MVFIQSVLLSTTVPPASRQRFVARALQKENPPVQDWTDGDLNSQTLVERMMQNVNQVYKYINELYKSMCSLDLSKLRLHFKRP